MATNKEQTIKKYMDKLGISATEAIQLIEDDARDFIGADGEKMTANANQYQHREKSDTKPKTSTKKRKIDADKLYLFKLVQTFLKGLELNDTIADVTSKTETELTFKYNGACYTWKFTKHKNPK